MSSPQLENGYTKISNELIDAWAKIRISGEANQIFIFIIRKTYGWGKKTDRVSLSQIALGTGIEQSNTVRAIKHLMSMNLITKEKAIRGSSYSIQKDYDKWKPIKKKKKQVIKPDNIQVIKVDKLENDLGSVNNDTGGSVNNDNLGVSIMTHTKETNTKEIIKEIRIQSSQGEEWVVRTGSVINLFREINPSYEILYKRKVQHDSARRLIEREGFDKLQKVVGFITLRRTDRYCPQIASPLQLEEKWSALEKYALSLKKDKVKIIGFD